MNTQQQDEFAVKIVTLLDPATKQIDGEIAAKLLEARKEALAHFQGNPARAWMPQWAMAAMDHVMEPFGNNLRAGFVLLALFVSIVGVIAWQTTNQQGSEIAEIDVGLLTDELPINAYLDKGFDSWLKRP